MSSSASAIGRRVSQRNATGLLASILAIALLVPPAPTDAAAIPSVRLVAARDRVVIVRSRPRPVRIDPGVFVASTGGAFELRVSRPDYDTPIGLTQVDAGTGTVLRTLPADLLNGWESLRSFFRVRLVRVNGGVALDQYRDFCPNSGGRVRLDDSGPDLDPYPSFCGGTPLTRGMVWGIDEGWATNPFSYGGGGPGSYDPEKFVASVRDGAYELSVSIAKPYLGLFGIPQSDAHVTVEVIVKTESGASSRLSAPEGRAVDDALSSAVPDDPNPDPSTVPNLIAHPAWSMGAFSKRRKDLLGFAATEWNEGPAPLVIEGFRRPGGDLMDAYQYFYAGDTPVGRALVGTLEYEEHEKHNHWHFTQFVRYRLLDETKHIVVRSAKVAFCLVPTDAVDLTVPNANWQPEIVGLASACGRESSVWIRETLDVGWGDTYFQFIPGQAFNITNVPNGKYFIEVEVNPNGDLHETTTADNSEMRPVWLAGRPGDRRVNVPLWHGIDTESGY